MSVGLFMDRRRGGLVIRRALQVALLALFASLAARAQVADATGWPRVPPVDWSKLSPADFADDELDLPYYLAHFHRLANSVVETGENRGFIDLAVWRGAQDNRPHNARVMENVLSLAFFYSTRRPWNQYYGSPAVRARLEAALDFWCRIQSADGRFSEYSPRRWNLAATAFATKFMGQTLTLQRAGPPVDAELLRRVAAADRRAIRVVLTDRDLREHGKRFTNQYTNAWAGAFAYLSLYPDAELSALLRRDVIENTGLFQSPAGYFYEARGPDWGYNLGTHHSNLAMAWHYARRTALGRIFAEEERRFVEWLAYNAVREPDGSGFTLNRAVETRQRRPFIDREETLRGQEAQGQRLLGSAVEQARAFLPTRDEVLRERERRRAELIRNWPPSGALGVGAFSAFSPYVFLHRSHEKWYPTAAERAAAVRSLPYMRRWFTHQRVDGRERLVFTFVRRPDYYAAFNSGTHLTGQQRYGLGLVWHPEAGSLVQSQTGTTDAAWGTVLGDGPGVFEADTLDAELLIDGVPVTPRPGNRDLPAGVLTVRYVFSDQGDKTLTFDARRLTVAVQHSGPLRENIPLLVGRDDALTIRPGEATLTRAGLRFRITFDADARAEAVETDLTSGPRRVITLRLTARNSLTYRLDFSGV